MVSNEKEILLKVFTVNHISFVFRTATLSLDQCDPLFCLRREIGKFKTFNCKFKILALHIYYRKVKFVSEHDLVFLSSNYVLQISSGIDDVGSIRWELAGYLILAWLGAYLVVWKGLHGSGKVYIRSFYR